MAMLVGCRMIHSASLRSDTLGKNFFALVQVDPFCFLHCELSTGEGEGTKLREAERRAWIPSCTEAVELFPNKAPAAQT